MQFTLKTCASGRQFQTTLVEPKTKESSKTLWMRTREKWSSRVEGDRFSCERFPRARACSRTQQRKLCQRKRKPAYFLSFPGKRLSRFVLGTALSQVCPCIAWHMRYHDALAIVYCYWWKALLSHCIAVDAVCTCVLQGQCSWPRSGSLSAFTLSTKGSTKRSTERSLQKVLPKVS